MGRLWVSLASDVAAMAPTRWVGLSGALELGMGGLERLELAEEAVVLRVRDLRRVVDVVGVIGALDLLAQARDLLGW